MPKQMMKVMMAATLCAMGLSVSVWAAEVLVEAEGFAQRGGRRDALEPR